MDGGGTGGGRGGQGQCVGQGPRREPQCGELAWEPEARLPLRPTGQDWPPSSPREGGSPSPLPLPTPMVPEKLACQEGSGDLCENVLPFLGGETATSC